MEDSAQINSDGDEQKESSQISVKGWKARHGFYSGASGFAKDDKDTVYRAEKSRIPQPLNPVNLQNRETAAKLESTTQPGSESTDLNSGDSSFFYKGTHIKSALPLNTLAGAENKLPVSSNSKDPSSDCNFRDIELATPSNIKVVDEYEDCPSSEMPSFYLSDSVFGSSVSTTDSMWQPHAVKENPYEALVDSLLASSRCEENDCDYDDCKQIKNLLFEIEEHWKSFSKPLTNVHKTLLMCMHEHFKVCNSSPCTFPWCCPQLCESLQEKTTKEEIISHLLWWIASSDASLGQEITSLKHFIQLNRCIEFDFSPKKCQAWLTLCRMGRFSKATLAKPLPEYMTESDQFWVLKRSASQNSSAAWEVYLQLAKLRNLQQITPLLWAAKLTDSDDGFIICSALEGVCLQEHLLSGEYLTSELVVKILVKLTDVLRHLQSMKIVYMNWTSKNILIHQSATGDMCIKLINFDASTIEGKDMDFSVLPVYLLPPEVLIGHPVTLPTDMWGLGCLLFELTTRRPVWHEHRHTSVQKLRTIMINQSHPRLPDTHWSLKSLYTVCWQVDPKKRGSVDYLHRLLTQY